MPKISATEKTRRRALVASLGFEAAKKYSENIAADFRQVSDLLNSYPKNAIGLTLPEAKDRKWHELCEDHNKLFAELRAFNEIYAKVYDKEIRRDRDERRAQKLSSL